MPVSNARRDELMRAAAARVLDAPDQVWQAIDAAVFKSVGAESDPLQAGRASFGNRVNITHWASHTLQSPSQIPPANLSDEVLRNARDQVRSGFGELNLNAFRSAQNEAWQFWMQVVFELTNDADELKAVLEFSARSIAQFVAETALGINRQMELERAHLERGSDARRLDLVRAILSGQQVDPAAATRTLAYRLDQRHQAVILWKEGADPDPAPLDMVAAALRQLQGSAQSLSLVEDRARIWMWLPKPINKETAEAHLSAGVRMTVGPSMRGLSGFRRSHERALIAQRVLAMATADRRVAFYGEVMLAAAFFENTETGDFFVAEILGDLAKGPADLQRALWTYLSLGANASHAAEVLSLHRNTLMRQLELAEALLPRPLGQCRIEAAAALEALRWRGRVQSTLDS